MADKYDIDCSQSLHWLKDRFTKTHGARQCQQLIEGLDRAIAATVACAPVRQKSGYFFVRDGGAPAETSAEALWERAMWEQFRTPDTAVPGAWYRLLNYQVPLRNTKSGDDKGWGKVDLIGVSHHGAPVVVELKQGRSTNTPAKMIVQAAAYAIALRKAWEEGLREQWLEELGSQRPERPREAVVPCPRPLRRSPALVAVTTRGRRW